MAISCVPADLVKKANCFQCIPKASRRSVRSYLLCQITNATLRGGMAPPSMFPAPTGFTFDPASATAITASFAAPPVGATGTEIWTSADNITYVLDSTVPSPGTGNNVVAPAVGSFKWGKVRYVSGAGNGAFSAPSEVSGRVCDWITRVVANGGVNPTLTERRSANTFDLALVAAAIDSLMLANLLMIPSSLIGCLTPLYKVKGTDPWTNANFVIGDLTVNGLKSDGTTKSLANGINPRNDCTLDSNTLFLYMSVAQTNVGDLFGCNATQVDGLFPNDQNGGATNFYSQNNIITVAALTSAGFYLGSRVNNTDQRVYFANSTNAWAQKGFSAVAGGIFPNVPYGIYYVNTGGFSNRSDAGLSAIGHALGMTSAQGQTLFNAVDAFRIALGGGRV